MQINLLENILNLLKPVKIGIEMFGRSFCSIYEFDKISNYILEEIDNCEISDIQNLLKTNLLIRIGERRNSLLIHTSLWLISPKNIEFPNFKYFKNIPVIEEIYCYCKEIFNKYYENTSKILESNDNKEPDVLLKNNINESKNYLINKLNDIGSSKIVQENTLENNLKEYNVTGIASENIIKLREILKCVKPTSVSNERLFSMAGNVITKNRNKLGNENFHKICFLKSYFTNKKN